MPRRRQSLIFGVAILIAAAILVYRSSSRSEAARVFDSVRYDVTSIDIEWVANALNLPEMNDANRSTHFTQNEAIDQIMSRLVAARPPGDVSMPPTDAKLTLHLKNGSKLELEMSPPIVRGQDGRLERSPLNYLVLHMKQRRYVIEALPDEMVEEALKHLRGGS